MADTDYFFAQDGKPWGMYRSLNVGNKHFHCQNANRMLHFRQGCRHFRHGERLEYMTDFHSSLTWWGDNALQWLRIKHNARD